MNLESKILGRAATEIAGLLIGKGKPYYAPYADCGDYIVVVNLKKVRISGKKSSQKMYDNYSGYPGGRKSKSFSHLMEENPRRILMEAVAGMLPKNKLRDRMMKRLYIYEDENHPYKSKFKNSV